MNVSRADIAMLQARREAAGPVTERAPGELMAVWIAGKLDSRVNGPQGVTLKGRLWRAKKIKALRAGACELIFDARVGVGVNLDAALEEPATPKSVHFIAYVGNRWGGDNLQAAIKPIRDALEDMRVVDSDENPAHEWIYDQVVDRTRAGRRGVEIRVKARV